MKQRHRRTSDVLSPMGLIFLNLGFLPCWLVIFKPSVKELALVLAVDTFSMMVMSAVDRKSFHWFFRQYALIFPDFNWPAIATLGLEERLKLFRAIVNFPKLRALYVAAVSAIKIIPGMLVMVFYWHHTVSNAVQFALVLTSMIVANFYFYGAVFLELHDLMSRRVAEMHRQFDWSEVFQRFEVSPDSKDFNYQVGTVLLSVWIFTLVLQVIIIYTGQKSEMSQLLLQITAVGFGGLILLSRIWWLSWRFFAGGVESVFKTISSFDPNASQATLPLHSTFLLSGFEKTFNNLVVRLRDYERELTHWIFAKAEQSRYLAIGEVSGLIVHDLTGPLHVINFCATQLKEEPNRINSDRYINQLAVNAERSMELIKSLRSYLRDSSSQDAGANIGESYDAVSRILETQFAASGYARISFKVDSSLYTKKVQLTRADLIHVLMNLIGNATQNLLSNSIAVPEIGLEIVDQSDTIITIAIVDNGTGLSSAHFERLTAFAYQSTNVGSNERTSMGLKLVRRLIERNGGTLHVDNTVSSGAKLVVRLQRVANDAN